jgi:hypothetical protein
VLSTESSSVPGTRSACCRLARAALRDGSAGTLPEAIGSALFHTQLRGDKRREAPTPHGTHDARPTHAILLSIVGMPGGRWRQDLSSRVTMGRDLSDNWCLQNNPY